ncbi:MAG: transcription antitermination factor NusB [Nitrospirae bacterium]|nr:transcription antitermination factor NusB [Nitrospirota bacterium]
MSRRRAREYALKLLFQAEFTENGLSDEIWKSFWSGHNADEKLKDFTRAITEGTLKHIKHLDEIITKAADNWSVDRMSAVDRNILRIAAYELIYRDDIPYAVTINEAVEIAKKYSAEDSASFINGILDRIFKLKPKKSLAF